MKAYDLIKASEKFLLNLGYEFEVEPLYNVNFALIDIEKTKKENVKGFYDNIVYSINLAGEYCNEEIKVIMRLTRFELISFGCLGKICGKCKILENHQDKWIKFLIKELGEEYIDKIKSHIDLDSLKPLEEEIISDNNGLIL